MKTVKLKFADLNGRAYNISLNHACDDLLGEDGKRLINNTMDRILELQPFVDQLISKVGAEVVNREVTEINLDEQVA